MTPYENLCNSLDLVEQGKRELAEHYQLFWASGVLLKADQFVEIMNRSEKFAHLDPRSGSWPKFVEGFVYTFFPDQGNGYDTLNEAIEMFRERNDLEGVGAAQVLLAIYFKNNGQLEQAQSHAQLGIQNIGNSVLYNYFKGIGLFQAGEINHILKDYDLAIRYFEEGLTCINTEYTTMRPRMMNAIGTVYADTGELDRALVYYENSLKETEGKSNFVMDSKNYADIGTYYLRKGDLKNASLFQEKSMQIRREKNLTNPLITNYIELAEIHLQLKEYETALDYALNAVKLASEMKIYLKLYQAHRIVSSIYEAMGDAANALLHFKKFQQNKDEVLSQETARKINQLSTHHQVETAQKEKEIFKLRNVELKSALDEISASVRYARRIQEAILPPEYFWKKHLPDSFIIYKPKDIVAGDFYWMENDGDTVLFAVADCTGHGVPGALVSVVCSNALHRAVKEFSILQPECILDKACELVTATFEKSGSVVDDGMDISICAFNRKTKVLRFAGANNPALIVHADGKHTELTPTKQPVGKYDQRSSFQAVDVTVAPGDMLYMYTDGYADQFGGEKGKKFMHKNLISKLCSIYRLPIDEQQNELITTFESWRGNMEQVDDVCISGIRI